MPPQTAAPSGAYKRFAKGKTLAQAEFTSAEHGTKIGAPPGPPPGGNYGGPAKEAVEQQIANIKAFVEERTHE